jgi:hypothetical protein
MNNFFYLMQPCGFFISRNNKELMNSRGDGQVSQIHINRRIVGKPGVVHPVYIGR